MESKRLWDKPNILNWIANVLFAISFLLFLYGTLFEVVHLPIFPLNEVRVEGDLKHVTREQVKMISSRYLQGNFFTVNLVKTRQAFEKLPWARNVSVRRRWPNRLEVVIEEHQELARWGNIALVNTHGELFHGASDSDLPVFYGPGNGVKEVAEHYGSFNNLISPVKMSLTEVTLTPRRSWQITTSTGMVISLGREEMDQRLARFVKVYSKTYAGMKGDLSYVDLRYPSGFAVRSPMALAAFKAASAVPESKVLNPNKAKDASVKKDGSKKVPVKKEQVKKDVLKKTKA
ncbi:MAG: cell division protein FtsQ/DivIB [Methylophilaceae bacterium]|jgi:cell division protein FtsQ